MATRWLLIGALLLVSLSVTVIYRYDRGLEQEVHLTLRYSHEQVTALVNGREVLTQTLDGDVFIGRRLGLYVFKSFDVLDSSSYLHNLRIGLKGEGSYHRPLLTSDDLRDVFEDPKGWKIVPGKGLTLEGGPGSRGVCLLTGLTPDEFVLDVDIRSPVDAGIFLPRPMRKTAVF